MSMRNLRETPVMTSRDRREGMVLIWTAIFLSVLIAFVGLALDAAFVLLTAHQLQNTADAASLAGAQKVRINQDDARQLAHDIGIANRAGGVFIDLDLNVANDVAGDIVLGRYDRDLREFTPDTDGPNAVKVVARRTDGSENGSLPLIFAPTYGVAASQVARSAIAMVGGGTGAGLIALNNTVPCGLDIRGTVTLTVNDGDIQVNSSHTNGVCANGTVVIDGPVINVNGGEHFVGGVTFEGEMNEGAPQIPDPLAYLPEPGVPAADYGTVFHQNGDPALTLQPGYYPGGITQTGGSLTLEPGIYYLEGGGLNINGGDFWAEGVMFFVHEGPVDINGNGIVHVTPPDPDDPRPGFNYPDAFIYEGVSIFQARDNTTQSRILGTSLLDLQGTLYFSGANLIVEGTGDGFGNQLIADTIDVRGTGEITINYNGQFPAPGNKVFLVE